MGLDVSKQEKVTNPATSATETRPPKHPPPHGREPGMAGWLIDPTRRHQIRYWTGGEWTASVSDNGVRTVDPIEPARPQ